MMMSVADYEEISFGQFINKIHGFYEREQQKQKEEWMRVNYAVYNNIMLSPDIKPVYKPKSFDDFLKQNNKPKKIESKQELDKWLK